jgi:hypothetical protein
MNASILRRLVLADNVPPPSWRFRIVDYFALGFILLVPELVVFHPQRWYLWSGFCLAAGVICAWFGDVAPGIWTRIVGWWPWHQLRVAKADLVKAQQENSEIRARRGLTKPQHNVQYVGFKFIDDDPFKIAALIFQNVPTGKLLGKFTWPRLRVTYYDHATGLEIISMGPMLWWNSESENGQLSEIDANENYAEIAYYFQEKWMALELNTPLEPELYAREKTNSVDLPIRELRIVAMLSGDSSARSDIRVTGILTLRPDGSASFRQTTD